MSQSALSTRVFCLAVALVVAGSIGTSGPSFGAPKAHVELEYVPKTAEKACVIEVVPDPQTIWKDNGKHSGKPHKVKWWVIKDQWETYHWKIEWKGSGTNYLGPVDDIECDEKKTYSKSVGNPSPNKDLYWEYKVSVHKCPYESREPALCEKDPKIGIQD